MSKKIVFNAAETKVIEKTAATLTVMLRDAQETEGAKLYFRKLGAYSGSIRIEGNPMTTGLEMALPLATTFTLFA